MQLDDRVTFVTPEDAELIVGARGDDASVAAIPQSVETTFHLWGSETEPQLFEPKFPPGAPVGAHAHVEDEVFHVLEGELRFGAKVLGPGSTVFIPGGTFYGFTAGPDGVRVLNFRPRADFSVVTRDTPGGER